MTSPSLLFTSESVTEGHPDKMCDQISDAVLDAIFAQDPMARVACETAIKTGFVMCLGEITDHRPLSTLTSWCARWSRRLALTTATRALTATPVACRSRLPRKARILPRVSIQRWKCAAADGRRDRKSRCWRPGHDVWLCLQRNTHLDARADLLCPQTGPPPGRSAQEWHVALAAPRWQDPGHGRICNLASPSASTPC